MPLAGLNLVTVSLRRVVPALPTGAFMTAIAVSLTLRLRASARLTLRFSVRDSLAANFMRARPATLRPCLSVSLPVSANAYGFVTVTATLRLASEPAPGSVTRGPDLRIAAYGSVGGGGGVL